MSRDSGTSIESNESAGWHGFWIGQRPAMCCCITYLNPIGAPEEGWHLFRAEAVAQGFKALFEFESQLGPFAAFRDQALIMYKTLQGEAHFESTEDDVSVDGTMDRFGHVFWRLTLSSPHGHSADAWTRLTFSIEEDQTLLWNVSAKIEDMLEWLGTKQTKRFRR